MNKKAPPDVPVRGFHFTIDRYASPSLSAGVTTGAISTFVTAGAKDNLPNWNIGRVQISEICGAAFMQRCTRSGRS
jgi:hypothetical protein